MSELPIGWEPTTLGDIAAWGSGGTPSRSEPSYYGGDIPWIKTGELGPRVLTSTEESISEEGLAKSSAKLFPAGSVAIAMYGATIGKTSILGISATTNQACAVGIPQPQATSKEYLYHFLCSQKDAFIEAGKGGAQPNISQGVIKDWPIPLAPLPEQKRIADKLDSLLARVDACRNRLDRLPALLKRFRQSILAAATSGRLTEDWREKSSIIWSPLQTAIGKIGEVVTGSTPSKKIAEHFGGTVPFFKPSELNAGFNTSEAKEYLTDSGANQARLLPPRTVMVTCIGATIGKTALSRCTGATNQQINSVICNEAIVIPEWLYFWCESPTGQMAIIDNSSATTLPILNKSRFMALGIEIPPLPEQTEIVRRVEVLFAFADRLEARLATASRQVSQLTPTLLAKAFRGELVAQDPADEPATELLKRLAAQHETAPKMKRSRKIANL